MGSAAFRGYRRAHGEPPTTAKQRSTLADARLAATVRRTPSEVSREATPQADLRTWASMLTCEFDPSTPIVVVRLAGTLDLAAAVDVRIALHKAAATQPTAIVIDLNSSVVTDPIVLAVFTAFARSATEWPGCPVLL